MNWPQNAEFLYSYEEEKDLQSGETHLPHWNKMCQETRVSDQKKSRYWAEIHMETQTQPMVTPEADEVSDEDFSDMNPSSPATGPPPSAEQRGRSRRDERSRSRERTPPHSSSQEVDED